MEEENKPEISEINYLQEEKWIVQKRTYTRWINSFLKKGGMEVEDLFVDISDGTKLIKLMEIISDETLGEATGGESRFQKLENVNKALQCLSTKIGFHDIKAADIVDGNPKAILSLVWTIIQRFHIKLTDKFLSVKPDMDITQSGIANKTQRDSPREQTTDGHSPTFSSPEKAITYHSLLDSYKRDTITLLRWIERTIRIFMGKGIPTSLPSFQIELQRFEDYLQSEKEAMYEMKLEVEKQLNTIKLMSQDIFGDDLNPKHEETLNEIQCAWETLEREENMWKGKVSVEHVRLTVQEKLQIKSGCSSKDNEEPPNDLPFSPGDKTATKLKPIKLQNSAVQSEDAASEDASRNVMSPQYLNFCLDCDNYERCLEEMLNGLQIEKQVRDIEKAKSHLQKVLQDLPGLKARKLKIDKTAQALRDLPSGFLVNMRRDQITILYDTFGNTLRSREQRIRVEEAIRDFLTNVDILKCSVVQSLNDFQTFKSFGLIQTFKAFHLDFETLRSKFQIAVENIRLYKNCVSAEHKAKGESNVREIEEIDIIFRSLLFERDEVKNLLYSKMGHKIFTGCVETWMIFVKSVEPKLYSVKPCKGLSSAQKELKKHLEIELEISSRYPSFEDVFQLGTILINNQCADVDFKVFEKKDELIKFWEKKKVRLQLNIEYQDFLEEAHRIDQQILTNLEFISNKNSRKEFEAAGFIPEVQDFQSRLAAQAKGIQILVEKETKLVNLNHPEKMNIHRRAQDIKDKHRKLEVDANGLLKQLIKSTELNEFMKDVVNVSDLIAEGKYSKIDLKDLKCKFMTCKVAGEKLKSSCPAYQKQIDVALLKIAKKWDKFINMKKELMTVKIELFTEKLQNIERKLCAFDVSEKTHEQFRTLEKELTELNSDSFLNLEENSELHKRVEEQLRPRLEELTNRFRNPVSAFATYTPVFRSARSNKPKFYRTDSGESNSVKLNPTPIQINTSHPRSPTIVAEPSKTPVVSPTTITGKLIDQSSHDLEFSQRNNMVYGDGKLFGLVINVGTNRQGAENDEITLVETLRRCGFEVDVCSNWSRKGIEDSIEGLKTKTRTTKEPIGAVLVTLASHGETYDYFKTSDDFSMDLYAEVVDKFNGVNCKELQTIPKVFLVNVCRGDKIDVPKVQTDSYLSPFKRYGETWSLESWWKVQSRRAVELDSMKVLLPTWTNLLIAHASYDGHVAYRDTHKGTWFFQEFCQVLRKDARKEPMCLESILKKVSVIVSLKSTEAGEKQMPTWKNVGFHKSLLLHYK